MPVYRVWALSSHYVFWTEASSRQEAMSRVALNVPGIATVLECEEDRDGPACHGVIKVGGGKLSEIAITRGGGGGSVG
jgi:hypothetical protein